MWGCAGRVDFVESSADLLRAWGLGDRPRGGGGRSKGHVPLYYTGRYLKIVGSVFRSFSGSAEPVVRASSLDLRSRPG